MGFLAGQYLVAINTLLLHVAFVLACVKGAACWMILWLGFADDDSSSENSSSSSQNNQSMASAATVAAIREWLPVSTFGDYLDRFEEMLEDEAECAVCLCKFQEEDEIRELCNCRHIFHRACLDKWLDHRQMTCPLCRCCLLRDMVAAQGIHDNSAHLQSCSYNTWVVDTISFVFASDMPVYDS